MSNIPNIKGWIEALDTFLGNMNGMVVLFILIGTCIMVSSLLIAGLVLLFSMFGVDPQSTVNVGLVIGSVILVGLLVLIAVLSQK